MDFNDFNTPVKSYFDDRNYFYLTPTATKVSRVYLEQNEVVLNDDYLQIQSTPLKQFFSIEKTIVDIATASDTVIYVSILLGPNKNTYSRSVFYNYGFIWKCRRYLWSASIHLRDSCWFDFNSNHDVFCVSKTLLYK